jgi:hypothetical protein
LERYGRALVLDRWKFKAYCVFRGLLTAPRPATTGPVAAQIPPTLIATLAAFIAAAATAATAATATATAAATASDSFTLILLPVFKALRMGRLPQPQVSRVATSVVVQATIVEMICSMVGL